MLEQIRRNILDIKRRMADAAVRSGRYPDEITLVAVSKSHPVEAVKAAIDAGITDIGESRIQEAMPKIQELGRPVRWHMIGHLQTNKTAKAAEYFDIVQSVDSLKIAEALNRSAESLGRAIDCFLEINSTGETSKFGVAPQNVIDCIDKINKLEHLRLCGVMTIGPYTENKDEIRNIYKMTYNILREARKFGGERLTELSMGMSDDFEIAIEEGSTMVRVGTSIFGPRG